MQWCINIVSGIGWGSWLLMVGVVGAFWLTAVLGMAVLFRTSTQDGRRLAKNARHTGGIEVGGIRR